MVFLYCFTMCMNELWIPKALPTWITVSWLFTSRQKKGLEGHGDLDLWSVSTKIQWLYLQVHITCVPTLKTFLNKSISVILPSERWDCFKIKLTFPFDHQSLTISFLGQNEYLCQNLKKFCQGVPQITGMGCASTTWKNTSNLVHGWHGGVQTGDGTKQSRIRLITCDCLENMMPFFMEIGSDQGPPPYVSCALSFSGFWMTCQRSLGWFVRANECEGQKSICLGGGTGTQCQHPRSRKYPSQHSNMRWQPAQYSQ